MIFIIAGLCIQQSVLAQVYFSNRYDFYKGLGAATGVLEIDSGYLVAGGFRDSTAGDRKLGILYLDFDGNVILKVDYGKSNADYWSGGSGSFIPTNDGGYALGGGITIGGNDDAVLFKFNADLDTLWTKQLGGGGFETFYQCKQTPDSGFILIGAASSGGGDIWLVKTDSLGNLEWDTTYGGPGAQSGFTILVTSEGNYLFRGSDSVYMVDQSGNVLWKKIYTGSFAYFIETSDGNFVGCGGEFDTFLSGSYQQNWPSIIKIDTAGTIIWQKKYGPSRFVAGLNAVWELPDGSFAAAGQSNNNKGTPNGNGFPIGFILKVSAQGDSIWYREHEYDTCIKNQDYIRDMKPTIDGGFITAGFFAPRTASPCSDTGTQDIWVLKLDSCGCAYVGCDSLCQQLVGIKEITGKTSLTLKIYPNPASSMATIEIGELPTEATLSIYDITGRELKSYAIQNQSTLTINTKELGSGLYFLRLSALGGKQEGRILGSGKLVVE
ncbi:MAG: T9SS type A sorting domain-containing protein [Flavobacteriales bacterium]|nr:T9SS type A sorting domain-containing protein [Flavobacteriales bacterium]